MRVRAAMVQIGRYDLLLAVRAARVSGGQRGRARLAVPGNQAVLGGRRNAQRPN